MTEITLKIDDMSCQHCVMNVKKAVDAVGGVNSSDVSVGSANVTYDENKTDREAIINAVQSAGYRVVD
jgi:copper chaperone